MSFPTFTCVICGKTDLTRRTSYAYKNGRACRIHQEACDANHERQVRAERHCPKTNHESIPLPEAGRAYDLRAMDWLITVSERMRDLFIWKDLEAAVKHLTSSEAYDEAEHFQTEKLLDTISRKHLEEPQRPLEEYINLMRSTRSRIAAEAAQLSFEDAMTQAVNIAIEFLMLSDKEPKKLKDKIHGYVKTLTRLRSLLAQKQATRKEEVMEEYVSNITRIIAGYGADGMKALAEYRKDNLPVFEAQEKEA